MDRSAAITELVDPSGRPFHGRPFRVIMADRFVAACRDAVTDPWLAGLPLVGAVDQFVDSTDALRDPAIARRLLSLYG